MRTRVTKPKGMHSRHPVTAIYQHHASQEKETEIDVLDTDEDLVMKHTGEYDVLDTDEDLVMLHNQACWTGIGTITPAKAQRLKRRLRAQAT
jgi:hypothetical protein